MLPGRSSSRWDVGTGRGVDFMRQRKYLVSARRLVLPGLGALALAATTIVGPVAGAQDDTLGQTSATCGLATGLETGATVEGSTSDTTTGDSTTGSDAMAASPSAGDSTTTGTSDTAGTMASTPGAMEAASFDQQFIDMAIPHHATIVSAAGAAL